MMFWRGPVVRYVGRHRSPAPVRRTPVVVQRATCDVELQVEHIGIALRHMGAFEPLGIPGPWDDTRIPDEAWTLADIDLADMRAAMGQVPS